MMVIFGMVRKNKKKNSGGGGEEEEKKGNDLEWPSSIPFLHLVMVKE